jgi:hypothetical protein
MPDKKTAKWLQVTVRFGSAPRFWIVADPRIKPPDAPIYRARGGPGQNMDILADALQQITHQFPNGSGIDLCVQPDNPSVDGGLIVSPTRCNGH